MKKRKKYRFYRMRKAIGAFVLFAVVGSALLVNHPAKVYGYTYSMTGASPAGTVTITPVKGIENGGYYTVNGYDVTYTITKDKWEVFDDNASYGGYFYKGNQLEVSGGCGFAYSPDGTLWQAGALQLGALKDGSLIERKNVVDGTVSCTFRINSLSELPAYIAYAYHPASGAYRHITTEYGNAYHVWHYQQLAGTNVSDSSQIDMDGPNITVDIAANGKVVERDGILWSKGVNINVSGSDLKSGVGGIGIYQNGNLLQKLVNHTGTKNMTATYSVTTNGSYQVDGYDRLNNTCAKKSVTVNTIDLEKPIVDGLNALEDDFCLENKITVVAKDAGVGLDEKAYAWNEGEWTEESTYVAKENGTCTVQVRDALGNEVSHSIQIENIDNKPPVIENVKEDKNTEDKTTIVVIARDNEGGSGLHDTPYSFDGGKTWQKEPVKEIDKNGTYEIVVRDAMESSATKEIVITSFVTAKPVVPTNPEEDREDETNTDSSENETEENPNIIDVARGDDEETISDNIRDIGKELIKDVVKTKQEDSNIFHPLVRRDRTKTTIVENDELLSEPEEEVVESVLELQPIKKNPVQKVVVGALLGLLAAGVAALFLYLLLFYLHYSCVLYEIDDKQKRQRIARLRLQRFDTDWKVEIPIDKLGDQGSGCYALCLHPSFVKEETPAALIIVIDGRSLRENLEDEILFRI